jgi:hypothetical protein
MMEATEAAPASRTIRATSPDAAPASAADAVRIRSRQRAGFRRRKPRHHPQIGGMFRGDFRRKATLAEYGFRLPSCMDNRPLRFEEWDMMRPQGVAVSATPSGWELNESGGVFVR